MIAIFYSSHIAFVPLGIGFGLLLILLLGNKMGIRSIGFYIVIGFGVWVAFLLSGVHATIAGVLVAFTIPARTRISEGLYAGNIRKLSAELEQASPHHSTLTTSDQHHIIEKIKKLTH